ncbi:hypothetical protein Tco_0874936 [Tanacetum coccineum]|uniref:Uncharacterized protein n=1 Tax=Tanacetum coccineum TaxID=301880 RepID=A0ABQ5BN21_9ASTR
MAVKGTRKRSYESDDDLSVVSRPFKISCLEKVDEKTSAVNVERDYSDDEYVEEDSCGSYEKGGSVTGDEGHEADDLLDQESCFERRRRLYAGDTYTDDEAEYSRYWDEALRSDDSKRVFVEQELSCEKGGNVTGDEGHEADDLLDQESCYERRRRLYAGDTYTDDEAEYSRYWDEALRSDDSKRVFVEQELSCEKGGNVTGDEGHEADDLLDQESCFERRRRLYAGDTYTDDEAEYSRYWDEALRSDDSKRVFVEQELSCEKSGNVTGDENLDEQECSCEKSGNVTGDENVDEECSYENSCDVAGKFSDNNGCYSDEWHTNDKAIYCREGWFIGRSSE